MKKVGKIFLSLLIVAAVFNPLATLTGIEQLTTTEAHAAKKSMSKSTFNKQASALSRQIKAYKVDQADRLEVLNSNRLFNAENFAIVFEDDTLGLSDEELLTYYVSLVSKFAEREESLEEYFYQEEIDIISSYMEDIESVNASIVKLTDKISSYETKYTNLVKSKSYEAAISVRKNQLKAYGQLSDKIEDAIGLEYALYYDTEDIFLDLIEDEYNDEYDYDEDYEEDYY